MLAYIVYKLTFFREVSSAFKFVYEQKKAKNKRDINSENA